MVVFQKKNTHNGIYSRHIGRNGSWSFFLFLFLSQLDLFLQGVDLFGAMVRWWFVTCNIQVGVWEHRCSWEFEFSSHMYIPHLGKRKLFYTKGDHDRSYFGEGEERNLELELVICFTTWEMRSMFVNCVKSPTTGRTREREREKGRKKGLDFWNSRVNPSIITQVSYVLSKPRFSVVYRVNAKRHA